MVLVVSEEGEVGLSVTHNVLPVGDLWELLLVVLHVDVLQNYIARYLIVEGPLVTLVGRVDELWPQVNLKGRLEEE